ncbi:hypothetical protein D3C80_1801970 [compost metagenome]
MHQLGGELEIMETGLAFGRFDREVLQFPVVHRLARTLAPGLVRLGGRFVLVDHRRRGSAAAIAGRVMGLGRAAGVLMFALAATGCGGRSRRAGWAGLLALGFAEHFFECFEHGHLVNWLRSERLPV